MAADTLDRLLTALAVRLHAFSVCAIQQGWRLAFRSFEAVTVHYVLKGSGALRVGNGPWLGFAPQSVLVVPARQSHVVGEAGAVAHMAHAADRCTLLGDGLVGFTAGDGSRDTLMVCGAISASYSGALGLFDLLRDPMVEDFSASSVHRNTFDLMLAEVANPGLGTQAMTEVLMKQCLITLLRRHVLRDNIGSPLFVALQHPRLARAILAVIENPAVPHTVESLAFLAGMRSGVWAGQRQAGRHGPWRVNANYFGLVIPFLVDAGFHVICVDSRGHGRSTRSAQPYSYELMESDVIAMMDALYVTKADLVGWSDGGIIGIVMAIHHSDRLDRVFAFGANTHPDGLKPDFDKGGSFKQYEEHAGLEYHALSPTTGQYDAFLEQISQMWATRPHLTAE